MLFILIPATGIAILSSLFYAYWFSPSLMSLLAYSAWSLVAVGIALGAYILTGGARKASHQRWVDAEIAREQALYREVEALAEDLTAVDETDAASQAGRLLGMLEDYRKVIEQKLGTSTITLSSFSAQASSIFRIVKHQLSDILAAANSVRTARSETVDSADEQTLMRRKQLVEQQSQRINDLLLSNRELLTALNETTVQVANIRDLDTFEVKESLARLKALGERAGSFNKA